MSSLTPRLSVRDLPLQGRRVFVRADFNVPLEDGRVADDTRIRAALPTLRHVLEAGGSLVLASHLGRPKGEPDPSFSLAPVSARLATELEREVTLTEDCTSDETIEACRSLEPGGVILLENLRFHPGEKKGDEDFAARLAQTADEYVNDAFGTCHRADASVAVLPRRFERPAAGLLVEKEISVLGRLLRDPEHPFTAVLGGAKVSDKLPVIESLLPSVDRIAIGGAMAYTLLVARGEEVGASLVERELVDGVRELLERAAEREVELLLPSDHVVVPSLDRPGDARVVGSGGFGPGDVGVDVGPDTREAFARAVTDARTVLWNGPLGVFETEEFAAGTRAVGEAIAGSSAFSVVGGGDSVAALVQAGLDERVGHVSTGGGAMLEMLAGRDMPGLEALAPAEGA